MAYIFEPTYWNGAIFHLDEDTWKMSGDWDEYLRANQPIPASCFPKSPTFDGAEDALLDMFHTSRSFTMLSERARVVMEHWAPGQVEFIPVAVHAAPVTAGRLNFASAYYFINVLGRAQRLQWLEMPLRQFPPKADETVNFSLVTHRSDWSLRERAAGEPLIWRDEPWIVGKKRYSGQSRIFVEDILWRELDANFPDQLDALQVGE